MQSHFGLNLVTVFVLFPLLVVAFVAIAWLALKIKASQRQRAGVMIGGIFAYIGFCTLAIIAYYHLDSTFAKSFQFYTYAAVTPNQNPFSQPDGYTGQVMMMRTVLKESGQVHVVDHPNPSFPTEVAIFTKGQYIQGEQKNNLLMVPQDQPNSLPRTTNLSFFWALTKSLLKVSNP